MRLCEAPLGEPGAASRSGSRVLHRSGCLRERGFTLTYRQEGIHSRTVFHPDIYSRNMTIVTQREFRRKRRHWLNTRFIAKHRRGVKALWTQFVAPTLFALSARFAAGSPRWPFSAGITMSAAARPLVSVISLDNGEAAAQTTLPVVFTAPIRCVSFICSISSILQLGEQHRDREPCTSPGPTWSASSTRT